jgi:hypothetical protein
MSGRSMTMTLSTVLSERVKPSQRSARPPFFFARTQLQYDGRRVPQ